MQNNGETIFDISKDAETGEFQIMFNKYIALTCMPVDLLLESIAMGKKYIIEDGSD